MSAIAQVNFPPTLAGISEARSVLDVMEKGLRPSPEAPTQEPKFKAQAVVPPPIVPVRAVYDGGGYGSRTREFLEVLPGGKENAMTFEELGARMGPDNHGNRLTKASVRACYRNVKRVEYGLKESGLLDRAVVEADFERYEAEGAGLYYLDPEDRAELDRHLGR